MKFKSDIEVQAGLRDGSNDIGTAGQLLSSTGTITNWIDQAEVVAAGATRVLIACKNTSGGTITKGTPVYQTGNVGATDVIEVAEADALISTGYLPAIGLLETDLINNAFGHVVITGELLNITTDPIDGLTPTTGDTIYLKSGGGLTLTKPTGEGNAIQNLGLVGKVSGGNAGSLTVASIMRQNDVPNLPTGKIWVGDGNTIVSDVVYLDETNERMGIRTTSPGATLEVQGRNSNTEAALKVTDSGDSFFEVVPDNSTTFKLGDIDAVGDEPVIVGGYSDLKFNVSGSTTMTLDNNNRVGIGTTSPDARLEVSSSAAAVLRLTSTDTTVTQFDSVGRLEFKANDTSTGGNNVVGFVDCISNDRGSFGTALLFGTTKGAAATEKMRINPTGNVGIGTTSPGDKLVVQGDGDGILVRSNDFTLSRIIPRGQTSTNWDKALFSLYNAAAENVRIDTAGSSWFNGGNVGIGTTSPYTKLQVASASGSDVPTAGTATGGLFISNSNKTYGINMGVSGSGWGFIQSQRADANATLYNLNLQPLGGNVGINDTTPSYKLDVNGEGRFTGDLRCLSLIQTSQSDKKEFISDIVKTTNKKIEFKEYVYKSDSGNRKRYGVLAEDIEVNYPELVHVDADGVKGVNYIDLLVKRVSELEKEIEDIAPRSMFLNWRGYHSSTNNGVLYDSGWSTNLTYPYATIIAPFKGSVTKVSITNNPYSSYQSGPTGDRATLEVVIDGRVVDGVTVNYSKPSANEIITFNFSGNHEFSENNKVQLRFQSNGLWRYINTGIQLKETI